MREMMDRDWSEAFSLHNGFLSFFFVSMREHVECGWSVMWGFGENVKSFVKSFTQVNATLFGLIGPDAFFLVQLGQLDQRPNRAPTELPDRTTPVVSHRDQKYCNQLQCLKMPKNYDTAVQNDTKPFSKLL